MAAELSLSFGGVGECCFVGTELVIDDRPYHFIVLHFEGILLLFFNISWEWKKWEYSLIWNVV